MGRRNRNRTRLVDEGLDEMRRAAEADPLCADTGKAPQQRRLAAPTSAFARSLHFHMKGSGVSLAIPPPDTSPSSAVRTHRVKEPVDWWSAASAGPRGHLSRHVVLTQYDGLHALHFLPKESQGTLAALCSELQSAFGGESEAVALDASAFVVGLHVVAVVENFGPNRVEIVSISDSGVEVLCMDFGTTSCVDNSNIFALPKAFSATPKLAKKLSLSGWVGTRFDVPCEARLEDYVLAFCDEDLLAPEVRLIVDRAEDDDVVNVFREDADAHEWIELAKEVMDLRLVLPKSPDVATLDHSLRKTKL